MAKRTIDWRAAFKKILQPKLLKALRDDAAGRIPLRAAQRRAIRAMLSVGDAALAVGRVP